MNSQNSKHEAIKAAYGEHWEKVKDYVDENGWCTHPDKNEMFPETDDLDSGYVSLLENTDKWMPTPLDRIIDNNGWTRIESEDDLPKEYGVKYFCFHKDGEIIIRTFFEHLGWGEFDCEILDQAYITHYQPIETPKPPIF
ncbi:TPA: hypothetical protein ACG0AV_002055 [Elizabethkingia anophelis]